jgi:hypothetical protein
MDTKSIHGTSKPEQKATKEDFFLPAFVTSFPYVQKYWLMPRSPKSAPIVTTRLDLAHTVFAKRHGQ